MSKLKFSYEKNGPDVFGEMINNLSESNVRFMFEPGGSTLTINIFSANYKLDYTITSNENIYTVEITSNIKILKDIKHLIENIHSYLEHGDLKIAYITNYVHNLNAWDLLSCAAYSLLLKKEDIIHINTLEIIK